MASETELRVLSSSLQSCKEDVLEDALNKFLHLCDCGVWEDKGGDPHCGITKFVFYSPLCIELFQLWSSLDKVLHTTLVEAGIVGQEVPSLVFKEKPSGQQSHVMMRRQAHMGSLLVSSFALVLQHSVIDTSASLTEESRYVIASRLLQFCLRSFYRLLYWINSTTKDFLGVCRLLRAFSGVSESITLQFLTSFHFTHPIFQSCLLYPSCSLNHLKQALREGRNCFLLGVWGSYHSKDFMAKRQCRKQLINLFVQSMTSIHTLQVMKKKMFACQILTHLPWDAVEDCQKVVNVLFTHVAQATGVSRQAKLDFFSLDIVIRLGTLYSLYMTVVDEMEHHGDSGHLGKSECPLTIQVASAVLSTLESLLRSIVCGKTLFVSKSPSSAKILLNYPRWIQLLFFPKQQHLLCALLDDHEDLALQMLEALNSDASHEQLCIPSSLQPRLCAIWIRYVILITRFLVTGLKCETLMQVSAHPETFLASGPQFKKEDEKESEKDINVFGSTPPTPKEKPKETYQFPETILGFVSPLAMKDLFSMENIEWVESWATTWQGLEETQRERQELYQLIFRGCSRLVNESVLTSMILHPSACMVFLGLGLVLCILARVEKCQKMLGCHLSSDGQMYLKHLVVSHLPDMVTLVQLFPRFCNRGSPEAWLNYAWDYTVHLDQVTIPFDFKKKTFGGDVADMDEDADLQLPTVEVLDSKNNEAFSFSKGLQTRTFPLKDLLFEFEGLLVSYDPSLNGRHELFLRWCFTMERIFRVLSVDHTMTKFDWSQLLHAPCWNSKSLPKALVHQDIFLLRHRLAVLKLLDAVWKLKCFPSNLSSFESCCTFDETSASYMKGYCLWFERLVCVWKSFSLHSLSPSKREEQTSLRQVVHRFLKKMGLFVLGSCNDLDAWMEVLHEYTWASTREAPEPNGLDLFFFTLRTTWVHWKDILPHYQQAVASFSHSSSGQALFSSTQFPLSLFSITFLTHILRLVPLMLSKRGTERRITTPLKYSGWPRFPSQFIGTLVQNHAPIGCLLLSAVIKRLGREAVECVRCLLQCTTWHGLPLPHQDLNSASTSAHHLEDEATSHLLRCVLQTLCHKAEESTWSSQPTTLTELGHVQVSSDHAHSTMRPESCTMLSHEILDAVSPESEATTCDDVLSLTPLTEEVLLSLTSHLSEGTRCMERSGFLDQDNKGGLALFLNIQRLFAGLLDDDSLESFLVMNHSQDFFNALHTFYTQRLAWPCTPPILPFNDVLLHVLQQYLIFMYRSLVKSWTKKQLSKKNWNRSKQKVPQHFKVLVASIYSSPWIQSSFQHCFLHQPTPTSTYLLDSGALNAHQLSLLRLLAFVHSLGVVWGINGKETVEEFEGTFPEAWLECLVCEYFYGSMLESDQLIRLFIQNPLAVETLPLREWVGGHYGHLDFSSCAFQDNQLVVYSKEMNWLSLSPSRCCLTLENFPFTRVFSPHTSLVKATKLTQSDISPAWVHSHALRQAAVVPENCPLDLSHCVILSSWLTYDVAYLFPYLLGRFHMAWSLVNKKRKSVDKTANELSETDHGHNTSQEILSQPSDAYHQRLSMFSLPLDPEGVWLRRIASEGVLQLLFMGLSCTDRVLRKVAQECLSIYRELLVWSEHDAKQRALKQRRRKAWTRAVRLCRDASRSKPSIPGSETVNPPLHKETIRETVKEMLAEEKLSIVYSFKNFLEILTLVNLIKNALCPSSSTEEIPPLPTPVAAFASSCVPILLQCSHPMYLFLTKYLLSRPFLLTENIPMFLSNYWSPRVGSWRQEMLFGCSVVCQSFGSHLLTFLPLNEVESPVDNVWKAMNAIGAITSLLNSCVDSIGHYTPEKLEEFNYTNRLFDRVLRVLLRLTAYSKYVTWLIDQYGLLEWMDFHFRHALEGLCQLKMCNYSVELSKKDVDQFHHLFLHRLMALRSLAKHLETHLAVCEKTCDQALVHHVNQEVHNTPQDQQHHAWEGVDSVPPDPLCATALLHYVLDWETSWARVLEKDNNQAAQRPQHLSLTLRDG